MRHDVAAMILAAGQGMRLRPFTETSCKPLLPLFDIPLVDHALRSLLHAGIRLVVVNLHHCAAALRRHLENLATAWNDNCAGAERLELFFSVEDELLGTGGGIAAAREMFRGRRLLVTNSDIFHTFDLARVLDHHAAADAEATVLLHDVIGVEHLRSTSVDEGGRVERIGRAGAGPGHFVFSGIYILEPAVYRNLPARPCPVIEHGLIPLLPRRRAAALTAGFTWRDLGTWESVLSTIRDVRDCAQRGGLEFGALVERAPGRFVVSGQPGPAGWSVSSPCYVGNGARITGSIVGPFAAVGEGACLMPGSVAAHSLVLPGVEASGLLFESVAGPGWISRAGGSVV